MEQRECPKCKILKDLSFFHKHKDRNIQTYCKECRKKIDKECWIKFSKNPEKMEKKKQYKDFRKQEARKYIFEYLKYHPCIDCGIADPIVLTFDHLNNKKFDIGAASGGKFPLNALKEEIEKCVVRCSNCHLRKTSKDFNYFKYKLSLNKNEI